MSDSEPRVQPTDRSFVALLSLLLLILVGSVSDGGPFAKIQAVFCVVFGVLCLAVTPAFRISLWLGLALLLTAGGIALSFLPSNLAAVSEWRLALQAEGVDTGSLINPHAWIGLDYFARVVVGLLAAVYLLSQRVSSRRRLVLAMTFSTGVGLHAVAAMWFAQQRRQFVWDRFESFGFFPNHNLTATLLVMGVLCGPGLVAECFRRRMFLLSAVPVMASIASVWALFAYLETRMGPILLLVGLVVWFVGLLVASKTISSSWLVGAIVVMGLMLPMVAMNSGVKKRLLKTAEQAQVVWNETPPASENTNPTLTKNGYLDIRFAIYRDAWSMIQNEPWTGTGLGTFEFVFPQHRRHSASAARCLHPESDWMWIATESGIFTVVFLIVAIGIVGGGAVRRSIGSESWPLRWSCLVAAAVVPIHGMVDIPGHSPALSLAAVWLAALTFGRNDVNRRGGRIAVLSWKAIGLTLLCVGGWLFAQASSGSTDDMPAVVRATQFAGAAEDRINQVIRLQKAGSDGERGQTAAILEQALSDIDSGLKLTPLKAELYYLRGAVGLHLGLPSKEADRAFAVQRILVPYKPGVAMKQAEIWRPLDANRAMSLWGLAIRDASKSGSYQTPDGVFELAVRSFQGNGKVALPLLELAGDQPTRLEVWFGNLSAQQRDELLPVVLNRLRGQPVYELLLSVWLRHDQTGKAKAYQTEVLR